MMKTHNQYFLMSVCIVLALMPVSSAETARGTVFQDADMSGRREQGEKGISGVAVSNGRDVVLTDADGGYSLPVDDDAVVFVIKPNGWRTPSSRDGIPRFYYVHKPAGSPDGDFRFKGVAATGPLPPAIDFPLYSQEESSKFKMVCFGDTQPRNQTEVDYIAHDVVEELIGYDGAFGVTLGDVVFNDLAMFKPLERVVGRIGLPWYNVPGNHDVNMKSKNDAYSDETWERLYGPPWHAFNYGGVHFIVLDDVEWNGDGYRGALGEEQLAFIKNDLSLVPEDKLVVLMMHIPLISVVDRKELYKLLEDRPKTFSLSAHWHRQAHFFIGKSEGWLRDDEHHHLVHATVCGSWWSGAKDENGIPHATMADGAPNGYSIITFDGSDYSIEFKAARRPADHQMNIYLPEVLAADKTAGTEVVVNVFAGSDRSTVDMRVGNADQWTTLTRDARVDPYYMKLKELEPLLPAEAGRKLPNPSSSTHIWVGELPGAIPRGVQLLHVRTVDMFGHEYRDTRSFRVE